MAVIRISPRVNLGQVLAKQINIENPTDFQYLFSGMNPVPGNEPGIRYNEVTGKWQFSHNATDWSDFGTGTGSVSGSGVPTYIIVAGVSISGDASINDGTNWGTNKALIKTIMVTTSATDWDLYILQNGNSYATNDADIPAMQLMAHGNTDEIISRDFPYEDEDATENVHLYFVDNVASNTADITVIGYALQ